MAVTRINNNQISDASAGNVYVGINASTKIQPYSITATKIANNLTYGSDLTVTGNLTVQGNTTAIDTTYTTIEDPILLLASTQTGSPSVDIGFVGERGTSDNIAFVWDESAAEFVTVYTTSGETNTTVSIASYADLHTGNANVGGNLTVNGTTTYVGNITGNLNVSGNIASGNLLTPGLISATGNITGSNLSAGSGIISTTGNINGANINATAVFASTVTSGNVDADNFNGGNLFGMTLGSRLLTNGNPIQGGSFDYSSLYVGFGGGGQGIALNSFGSAPVQINTGNSGANTYNWTFSNSNGEFAAPGDITTTGNVNAGNLNATANLVSVGAVVSGNVTGGNLLTGGRVVSTGNIVSAANIAGGNLAITGTITTATIETTGNVLVGGNLTVQGNLQYINVDDLRVEDPIIIMGTGPNGAPLTADDGMDRGIYMEWYKTGLGNSWIGWENSSGNLIAAADVVFSANNVVNVNAYGTFQAGNIYAQSTVATGNITGGNLTTTGLLTVTGNITGGNLSAGSGIISTTGNINGGNLNATTGVRAATGYFTGNVDVLGNLNASVGIVYANSGIFYGDSVTGNGAAYAGVPGYTPLGSNVVMQFAGNVNSYSQLNFQNINSGNLASTDFIATANDGDDDNYYIDIGINSSTFDDPVNYPGFFPHDSYVHAHGGNILINPETAGTVIKFMVGGTDSSDIIGVVNTTGLAVTGNVSATTALISGNITIQGSNVNSNAARITVNSDSSDTDFAVNSDTTANVFYVDAGTGTVSIGSSTQTTNAALAINATNSFLMPVGNTAQRPGVGVTGMLRFNSTLDAVEVYDTDSWTTVGTPSFTVITDQQFNGDGVTVAFVQSAATTTNSTIVSINGVLQLPTVAYSVSGNTLTFTEAPQTGDIIDVRALTTTTQVTAISNSPGNAIVQPNATSAIVEITGDLNPIANVTYNLGSTSSRWKDLYLSGSSITLGNVVIKNVAGGNTIGFYGPDGTTPATIAPTSVDTTTIANGTSSVSVLSSGGIIAVTVGGSDIVSFTSAGIINNIGNGTGNIGNSTGYFNTVFAKATSAQYADLAENYAADAEYAPGTVLSFGGDNEVTVSTVAGDRRIAGVVSTNPSYIMNSVLEAEHVVTIALTGRVPTFVSGPIEKGDMMVSAGNGRAIACATPVIGTVIGKALENHPGGDGVIEVVVGRL